MPADLLTMHSSFGTRFDPDLLDEEYRRWQEDPESVDSGWAAFFEGFELGDLEERDGAAIAQLDAEVGDVSLQTRVDGLVYAYRTLGHTSRVSIRSQISGRKIRCSRCANSG